ncbi:Fanconi anemia group I protein-like [Adelges cooleyi]|uniref:Fanconi anemia group I protein-like n=1 Tax=Adelges cooleyi TaxID=133065 RepID=UPI00217F5F73|nr:Fanconi anemia group I protein-like [Adelges cooleyi]
MSNSKITTLVDLANKRLNSSEDFDEFQSFVSQELDVDTIYPLIDEKIDREDGPKILEYILVGLSVKPDAQQLIEKVYEYVLNAINKAEISGKMKVCLISRLSLELNKLSTEQLIKFVNMCKKDIESSNENSIQSWKELIPQILKILSEVKTLRTEGLELTGAEYKEMIIKDICRYRVELNSIVPLALMFRRTQLSEKEHELVINMLCSYFDQMEPQEIPPLLQQMLHFCTSGDFLNLFCTLQKYFDNKYLGVQNVDDNDPFEIGSMQKVGEKKNMMEAESTVLFLLEDFAKVHASFVSDITKYIKNCIGAPNEVLGPFMLAFLLTMSCCGPYETLVISLVKKLVIQSLEEEENVQRSCWLRINYTNIYDAYEQFQLFIKSEISSYEKVFKGLVNLGLSFLGTTSSVFKKNVDTISKVHRLGLFIIVSLVNKRPFITGSVLRSLTNFIASNPTSKQYLECLHKLCKNQRATIVENNAELLRLFKEMPVGLTDKVTYAVMPVLKVSTYLRDNVIMILRKELMSKDFQLRHSAVMGFIEILCSVRLDSFTSLSQNTNSQDSWPGLFTQMVLDRNSVDVYSSKNYNTEDSSENNKTICLEILDILKTCFFQKAEIKCTLYRGLLKVTSHNDELCMCVTSLIVDHMGSWCTKRGTKKSLKFNKAIVLGKDGRFIIHEPLEELIIIAQHLLVKHFSCESQDAESDSESLKNLLCQLVDFYSECNTDEIKVNDNDSLLDVICNVVEYADIIKQILSAYQALIIYVINSWSSPDQDQKCCEKLQKLFSKYNHIIDAVKAADKTSKKKDNKGNKKTKGETTSDLKSSKFVEPIIHLDFDVLYKFVSLLTSDNNCSSKQMIDVLNQNTRLWEFVLKLILNHIAELKLQLSHDLKPRNLYENLCKLTKVLYNHFLFDIREKIRFDQYTTELGLECYLQIITLVSSYYKKLDKFLTDSNSNDAIDSSDEQAELFNVLRNIRSHLDTVLESNNQIDASISQDVDKDSSDLLDKIESHLIGCISVICHAINNNNPRVKNILAWLSTVIEKYSFSNTPNAKEFLTLTLGLYSANQEDPIMLADTIKILCKSFGRISKSNKHNESQMKLLRIITDYNKSTLCPVLCQCLCNELNHVLTCLSRIKAELNASQKTIKAVCQDRLKAREKAICHRTILVILATNTFTKSVIPLGQCTESVFVLLNQVFKTVNTVTKHFLIRSSYHEPVYKQALLGKLTQIINELLSPNVSKFIMFVEHDRPLTEKEKKSNQLKQQTKRQASYIPKVVTELETFTNLITKLGKKCKDKDLMNIKLTSSRDFRLNLQKLEEVLSRQDNSEDSDGDLETNNQNTAQNTSYQINASEQPPQKKRKSNISITTGSPVY